MRMYYQIELTQGQIAQVSPEDFEELSRYKWHAHGRYRRQNSFYAARDGGPKVNGKLPGKALMHRQIMGFPEGLTVDHINGDTLDNRRCNLRLATHAENQRNSKRRAHNTSGFKGVYWHEKAGRWKAGIRANNSYIHLGLFDTPESAHAVYCIAAKKYHGEFARIA